MSNESKCIVCGIVTEKDYMFCKPCFRKLRDNGDIEQCDNCGTWHYSGSVCLCDGHFVQCPDCWRWRLFGDKCICKTISEKANKTYQKKESLLSDAELLFFNKLEKVIDSRKYRIVPQMTLISIIDKKEKWKWKNELHSRVDFCIMRKNDFKPFLCIEYDDSTHDKPERKEHDMKVKNILDEADIELVRIKRNDNMSIDYLRAKLEDYL